MANQKFKDTLLSVLKADERLWQDGEFNQTRLFDLVDKHDAILLKLLLDNTELKTKFFVEVNGIFIFKSQDFKFFLDENKLDNSYTQFENIIGLKIGNKMLKDRDEVVLNFPFKDCVLQGGQSRDEGTDIWYEYDEKSDNYIEVEAKRKEVFFNEILAKDEIDCLEAPKALKNAKRYTKDGEVPVWTIQRDEDGMIRENLIIKWNNLLALHSIKKEFAGKVKLIYIDPPYNTGSDSFKYNDNFNHSTWLTFMKNRLEIAKELLKNDGVIFISIDDDESHYLKILCDTIFWRENFVANLIWEKKYSPQNDAKWFSDNHDHILVYSFNKEIWRPNLIARTEEQNNRYKNPDNDIRWPWKASDFSVKTYSKNYDYSITLPSWRVVNPPEWRCWGTSNENFIKLIEDNRIWFWEKWDNVPAVKKFLTEVKDGTVPLTILKYSEVWHNQEAKQELKVFGFEYAFDTPKPERLLQRILEIGTQEGDIILDFFAGSGTTGAVAHKMNRQYILIEQMDYITDLPEARLIKVIQWEQGGISKSVQWQGGGEFVYFELAEWNEEAKRYIGEAKSIEELEAFFDTMYERYFLNYNVKVKEFKEKVLTDAKFRSLPLDRQKDMFIRMLDLNQMYVNYTERSDKKFGLSENDISFSEGFYKN